MAHSEVVGEDITLAFMRELAREEPETEKFGIVDADKAGQLLMLSHSLRMFTIEPFQDMYVTNIIEHIDNSDQVRGTPMPRKDVKCSTTNNEVALTYKEEPLATLKPNELLGGFGILLKNEVVYDDTGEYKHQGALDILLKNAAKVGAQIDLSSLKSKGLGRISIPVFYIVGKNSLVRIPSSHRIVQEIVKNFQSDGKHFQEIKDEEQ